MGNAVQGIDGCTSTEVLQEILYRYSALRRVDLARRVYDLFVPSIAAFDAELARHKGISRIEL